MSKLTAHITNVQQHADHDDNLQYEICNKAGETVCYVSLNRYNTPVRDIYTTSISLFKKFCTAFSKHDIQDSSDIEFNY